MYRVSFLTYSASNNGMTLKLGLGVVLCICVAKLNRDMFLLSLATQFNITIVA